MSNWDWITPNTNIYCINLIHRVDRFNEVVEEFKKIKILDKIKFYQPKKDTSGIKHKGCFDSHIFCMIHAYNQKKNALIFEDDVEFLSTFNEAIIKHSYLYTDWNMLRIGYKPFRFNKRINYHVYNSDYVHNMTAYIVSYKYMDLIFNKDKPENCTVIDLCLTEITNKDYCITPLMAIQRNSKSDNPWNDFVGWQNIVQHPIINKQYQKFTYQYSLIKFHLFEKFNKLFIKRQ